MSSTGKIVRSESDRLCWPDGRLYKVVYRVEAKCSECKFTNNHSVDSNKWVTDLGKRRCKKCGTDYQLVR